MIWLNIIIATVISFLVQQGIPGATKLFSLTPALIASQPWTIITAVFMHADPAHLFFNMWALFVFGPMLEQRIGKRYFLALYVATGILANVAFMLVYPPEIMGLGASGAIFGIIGCLVMLEPNLPILFIFIPMPLWVAGAVWAGLDFWGMLSPASGIANVAHLAGLGVGLAAGYIFRKRIGRAMPIDTGMDDAIRYSRSRGYY